MQIDKYPRQFLVSTIEAKGLTELVQFRISNFFIYYSKTLSFYSINGNANSDFALLFGYAYDPEDFNLSEEEILKKILQFYDLNTISEYIASLSGRFVIFFHAKDQSYVFHDPCGLRTVYYLNKGVAQVFGTQPLIIGEAVDLIGGMKTELFFHSDYYKNADEYWMPVELSVYENISQLVPNHLLDLDEKKQIRYWPNEMIDHVSYNEGLNYLADELPKSIAWANDRFQLVLPITSGFDSRVLLAASKEVVSDLYLFTRIHKAHLNQKHPDIALPKSMLKDLGLKHNLIVNDAVVSNETEERYKLNNSNSRFQDALTLFSSGAEHLRGKVVMYGNVSEIGKVRNRLISMDAIKSPSDLNMVPKEWLKISFIRQRLDKWFVEAKQVETHHGISATNLFYWEHRIGNWAARAYNENDLLFEVFTPFNSRKILSTFLGIEPSYRSAPNYYLYTELAKKMWPEVMRYPVNPRSKTMRINEIIRFLSKKTGITKGITSLTDYLNGR